MILWSLAVIVSLFIITVSWPQSAEDAVKVKSVSWFEWFSDTFYKIFYVILMTAIFLCALYNFVKNKFTRSSDEWQVDSNKELDAYARVFSLMEPPTKTNLVEKDRSGNSKSDFSESENQLRQRLRQTQEEIQILRNQLTLSMDNKTELESTLALLDKEKITAEMQLELERVQGALELEKMKKENLTVKREIQKLLEEKNLAVKELERLDRDVRISQRATVDSDFLEDRLSLVRKEAEALKQQFNLLAEEKEKAASTVDDSPMNPVYDDVDLECNTAWRTPDFVREYESLD